ncbi:hypothetical protein OKW31_004691 [Paraburkholderia atlantica]|uniref:hypothetical protein n=1 Tax=Paraburkholderia atlantica TaxID=2654982 RepID=UPI003D20830B
MLFTTSANVSRGSVPPRGRRKRQRLQLVLAVQFVDHLVRGGIGCVPDHEGLRVRRGLRLRENRRGENPASAVAACG